MAKKFREKLRKLNPFTRPATLEELPKPLPANPDQRLVKVYVEGYEDVAFWREAQTQSGDELTASLGHAAATGEYADEDAPAPPKRRRRRRRPASAAPSVE